MQQVRRGVVATRGVAHGARPRRRAPRLADVETSARDDAACVEDVALLRRACRGRRRARPLPSRTPRSPDLAARLSRRTGVRSRIDLDLVRRRPATRLAHEQTDTVARRRAHARGAERRPVPVVADELRGGRRRAPLQVAERAADEDRAGDLAARARALAAARASPPRSRPGRRRMPRSARIAAREVDGEPVRVVELEGLGPVEDRPLAQAARLDLQEADALVVGRAELLLLGVEARSGGRPRPRRRVGVAARHRLSAPDRPATTGTARRARAGCRRRWPAAGRGAARSRAPRSTACTPSATRKQAARAWSAIRRMRRGSSPAGRSPFGEDGVLDARDVRRPRSTRGRKSARAEDGVLSLEHREHALEADAAVDVLLRERHELVHALPVELREDAVPDLDEAAGVVLAGVPVALRAPLPVVEEDLGARTADAVRALLAGASAGQKFSLAPKRAMRSARHADLRARPRTPRRRPRRRRPRGARPAAPSSFVRNSQAHAIASFLK